MALANGPYFFGEAPTVPDYILGLQTIWDVIFPAGDITAYPNLARHREAITSLSEVQRMLAQHRAESTRRKSSLSS